MQELTSIDTWMSSEHPGVPFERYADDVVAHCKTEAQAKLVLNSIEARLRRCKLEVHPGKTKIVYCKDDDRRGQYPEQKFTFLGYTFRPRRSKNRWGKCYINFTPAVSREAATRMRQEIRVSPQIAAFKSAKSPNFNPPGLIDVTVDSCDCTLLGEPVSTTSTTSSPTRSFWEQRARLAGPQTMNAEHPPITRVEMGR